MLHERDSMFAMGPSQSSSKLRVGGDVAGGGEIFLLDAFADGPVAFDEGLGGGAFGFLFAFADDAAQAAFVAGAEPDPVR